MFRYLVLTLFLLITATVSAQLVTEGGYFFGDLGQDYITITIPEGETLVESIPVENVIEGVGRITYSSVPIFTAADRKSRLLRYAIPPERMLITADSGDWYAVLMYNGQEGFIEKRHLKTAKVFYDESVTTNYMDKRLNFELRELTRKFNSVVEQSVYLEKYNIIPKLSITATSNRSNKMIITMEYSAVDANGNVIPSKQDNNLNQEMVKFIELMFFKMLTVKAENYKILIKKPVFSKSGAVLNMQGKYAEIVLDKDDVKEDFIESGVRIVDLVISDLRKEELFERYPH